MNWLKSLDRNECAYWLGLLMLFAGITVSVSMATALMICGGVMVAESVLTSYLSSWLATRTLTTGNK